MAKIAVVGATGMVGRTFLKVLEERNIKAEYVLYSSARSAGSSITFFGVEHVVKELKEDSFIGIDIALFSAGGETSRKFAPIAAKANCVVVDNSSCWRMDPNVPLVVPEVNPEDISKHNGIIANPNCSTIQAMVALKPLKDKYGIKRIIYSTYQSVSGAGMNGTMELRKSIEGGAPEKFPHKIAGNCIPHIDVFTDNGYTKEELKMIDETKKILHDDDLKITATTVRVPVYVGHSESINVELKKDFELDELINTLKAAPGIVIQNDHTKNEYPLAIDSEGKDEVFVGRIRRDYSVDYGVNLWVVADNTRKGAATNAVQIAEVLLNNIKGE